MSISIRSPGTTGTRNRILLMVINSHKSVTVFSQLFTEFYYGTAVIVFYYYHNTFVLQVRVLRQKYHVPE